VTTELENRKSPADVGLFYFCDGGVEKAIAAGVPMMVYMG
jgi:hypothetical protein